MATSVATGEVTSGNVTLSAGVEEVITFGDVVRQVEVQIVTDAGVPVFFTVDNTAASTTVTNKHCHYVPAGAGNALEVPVRVQPSGNTVVRVISTGAPTVRVTDADEI